MLFCFKGQIGHNL
jgi:hypothetical protein